MGGERLFPIDQHISVDESLSLYYGRNKDRILLPCQKIQDKNLNIGIIDNNNINPNRLLLIQRDREPIKVMDPSTSEIYTLSYPGKSAFLYFDKVPPDRFVLHNLVRKLMSNCPDRRDHLHLSTVGRIEKSGWEVYWAPLQMSGKLTHVRLIPNAILINSKDPTIEDAENLKNAFCLVC